MILRAPKFEDGRERYSAAGRPVACGTVRPRKMLLTCLLLLVSVFGLGAASAQAPKPNVILILTDDLGYGDVGAYGATDIQTPNIDRLASEGIAFSNFHVAPTCSITRVMFLTGSYAPRTGMSRNFAPSSTVGIHADEITLAELAKSAGYATGAFGKWHLGDHFQFLPRRHGFDEFFGIPHSNDMWPFHPMMPVTANEDPRLTAERERAELTGYAGQGSTFPLGEGFPNLPLYDGDAIVEFNSDQSTFTSGFTDRAIQFIEENASGPFFVYLPLTAPHVPLHPSVNFVGSSARDLYGDSVEEIDFHVGRILDKLTALGIDNNTLVIFASDNGPWLEYGIDAGSGMPYTGGKETQLEGGVRVPALMRWPGKIGTGSVVTEPVSAIDVLPTLAGLFGVPVPPDRTIDGLDIWSLLDGSATSLSRPAILGFSEAPFSQAKLGAVRDGDWKLRVNTSATTVNPVSLFDLGSDPSESINVSSSNGGVVNTLTSLGQQILNDINANKRSLGEVVLSGEPFVQNLGLGDIIAIEAEHFHVREARSGHNWDNVTESHNSAGGALRAQPNNGANINVDYVNTSPQLEYRINVRTPGRYYVWVRAKASSTSDDSLHVGLNGAAEPNGYRISNFESYWSWSSTLMDSGNRAYVDIGSAGEHVFDVWMREDGIIIDKILLTSSDQFEPQGQGLVESQQGTLAPALEFSMASMRRAAAEGDTTPLQQTVVLSTSDGSAAPFSISSSAPSWLTASPASGTLPAGSITLAADPSGMAAGEYTGTITATSSGYTQDAIAVTMTVMGNTGSLSASITSAPSSNNLTADGTADWAHWALDSASTVNRKAGVTTQISNITTLGAAGSRFVGGSARAEYSWTDGTPTGTTSTRAGLYYQGIGNGFEFTVPADTTAKRLKVHLGGWKARGEIELTLSDGSAPFVTTVEDLSTAFDRTLTVDFQTASPGQTLTVRYTLLTGSNITLQAATLEGGIAPPQPSLEFSTASLNYSANEGDTSPQQRTVSLSSSDGSGAAFSLAPSQSWLSVNPTSGTTPAGTVTVIADPSGLPAGQYTGTILATASGYIEDQITVTLNIAGDSGTLSASVSPTPSGVNLTADGTADWAHWGLNTASTINRKAGVSTQISNITALGAAGSRFVGGSARAAYNWTDGTPTGSANTGAGLYFQGTNAGFEFTVPADTTAKQLEVHLGGWQARGQVEVTMSDGTPSYVTTVENLSTAFDRTVTINFQAATPGQTLTFRYVKETGANITLQAATLVGNVAPPQPALEFNTAAANFNASEGDTTPLQQDVSLGTSDNSGASFSLAESASWLSVNPTSGTTPANTITITADPTGLVAGQYTETITATAAGYIEGGIDVTLNVAGDSGSLSGSVGNSASDINLTAEGTADWAHWALDSASSVNRKSGVIQQISDISATGRAGRRFVGDNARAQYSWNDGTPTGSTSTRAGLYFSGAGNTVQFTVAADTTPRTLRVHLGGYQARGRIEVTLSDGTVPPFVTTVQDLSNPFDRTLTVNFQAASAGQTLTFRYVKETGSNITLQAASVSGGGSSGLELPFTDNFDDGNSNGWSFVNETPSTDDWNAASGALTQANRVESVNSLEESYHLGTWAWLTAGTSLTDYVMTVELARNGDGRAESVGILFRYQDPDNYYRFTLNRRYGFSRLEKRENGVFSTLAVNALGDVPDVNNILVVEAAGPDLQISVNGVPALAATDNTHSSGSVGLFSQSPAQFDNIQIDNVLALPKIVFAAPIADGIVPGSTVNVETVVRNLPSGGSVEFSMSGQTPQVRNSPPWAVTFNAVPNGIKTITASLRDAGNSQIESDSIDIAVGGDYILAIGDSNPSGIGDTFASDNDDASRIYSSTAFASTLAKLLEDLPPNEVIAFNEGIGGDTTNDTDVRRLSSIIDRHGHASVALVQSGTNDANALRTANAFEADMQSLVSRLFAEGMDVHVATLPPILNAGSGLSSTRNQRIDQYNDRIRNNITGALSGADIWAFFAPDDTGDSVADRIRTFLFADDLHPNGLGHAIIAQLWYNVLVGDSTGTAVVPFIADFLSRSNYKLNLLEDGDEYLVDSAAQLTSVPASLQSAIWIMTAQADSGNSSTDFLSFDLDRNATVYVAYDADAGGLPNWLNPASSTFTEVPGVQLTTTQTSYRIFSRPVSAGSVMLGGNNAAGAAGASDMYLVGLLP